MISKPGLGPASSPLHPEVSVKNLGINPNSSLFLTLHTHQVFQILLLKECNTHPLSCSALSPTWNTKASLDAQSPTVSPSPSLLLGTCFALGFQSTAMLPCLVNSYAALSPSKRVGNFSEWPAPPSSEQAHASCAHLFPHLLAVPVGASPTRLLPS